MNAHTKYPIDTTDIAFVVDFAQEGLVWGREQYDWQYYSFHVTAMGGSSATELYFDVVFPAEATICGPSEWSPGNIQFLEFEGLAVEVNAPNKIPGVHYYTFDSLRGVAHNKFQSKEVSK
ncbi:MAG: hypothetical protein JWR35_3710 [Marmoricola sp.]|nr:hypothetical protein [Marmoricola sp.]